MADRNVTRRNVADQGVADRRVADRDVADGKIPGGKVAGGKPAGGNVSGGEHAGSRRDGSRWRRLETNLNFSVFLCRLMIRCEEIPVAGFGANTDQQRVPAQDVAGT